MAEQQVQIWFLGRLVNVTGHWVSAEYEDGWLVHTGYWEVTNIVDSESLDDSWLSTVSSDPFGDWISSHDMQLLEEAFADTVNQEEDLQWWRSYENQSSELARYI